MKILLSLLLITVTSVICVELENFNSYTENILEAFEIQREKRSPQRFQTLEYRRPPPPPPKPMRARRSNDEIILDDEKVSIQDENDNVSIESEEHQVPNLMELMREKRSPQSFQTLVYRPPPTPPPRPIRVRRSFDQNDEDYLEHETERKLEEIRREKRSPQNFQTLVYKPKPTPPPRPIRARRSLNKPPPTLPKIY